MPYPHGLFCWADVAVPNMAAGVDFYTAIFGWAAAETDAGSMPYTMFTRDRIPVAGMGLLTVEQRRAGWAPDWTSYISVDDVDPIATKAQELGASLLMEPFDVPAAGRMFYASDPLGAVVGFWEAGEHAGAGVFNEPGAMCWNELACWDVEAAIDFYTNLVGWKSDTQAHEGFEYTSIAVGDRLNGGIYDMTGILDDVPPHWSTWFAVDSADAAMIRLTELGGVVVREAPNAAFGKGAIVRDPQGAPFGIMELASP